MGSILEASSAVGRERWLAVWRLSGREPFGHPDFVALFAQDGEQVVCFVDEQANVLVPLIMRPLVSSNQGPHWDLVSPYGYGGPFGGGPQQQATLLDELAEWSATNRVVTTLLRMSLESKLERESSFHVVTHAENVRVDLARDPESVWRSYESKVRKNVGKATRSGCVVDRTHAVRPPEFVDVYQSTMARRSAAERYWFGDEFFDALESTGVGLDYYTVRDGDRRVVSVEAVLKSDTQCYSFLGGTLSDSFALAPNDLLKHQVILDGLESDLRWFVLGGGATPGDGIFRYKRSFARDGLVPFQTARAIHDRATYLRLSDVNPATVDWRTEEEAAFFPRYRR